MAQMDQTEVYSALASSHLHLADLYERMRELQEEEETEQTGTDDE